jgi:quercetin dioxygenase-like cupin family protein
MITHIDTETLERVASPGGSGEETVVLSPEVCGAESVRGLLRWLKPGGRLNAAPLPASRQLLYLMEGEGVFHLEGKEYPAGPGAGLYLGPGEGARIDNAGSATLKVFHLVVPPS